MDISKKIKNRRKALSLTMFEVAQKVGVSEATVSRWESGDIANMRRDKIAALASALQVPTSYIMGNSEDGSANTHHSLKIPVLGQVVAGVPLEAVQNILDYEEITEDMANTGEFFALQIKGDSMLPRMQDGDVVIVRQQSDVESGQIAIVLVNGDEATCKKYIKHENGISLVSFNPAYAPMFFPAEEVEKKPVQVIGRVVELRGKF